MKELLLIFILSCGLPINLLACKCGGPYDVEPEYKSSVLVFLGQVLKVEYVGLGETMHPDSLKIAKELISQRTKAWLDGPIILKATFLVKKRYKGEFKSDTLTIYTGNRSSSCGINFKENKAYVVYTHAQSYLYGFLGIDYERVNRFNKKNTYWTSHCMRTTEEIDQEQLLLSKYLGKE